MYYFTIKKEVPFNCKSLKYKCCQVWLLHCSYLTYFGSLSRKCWETEEKIDMKSHIRHCLQFIYVQLHYIKHTQYLVWVIMEEFLIIYIVRVPLPTHSKMELRSRTILVLNPCQGYHLKSFKLHFTKNWPSQRLLSKTLNIFKFTLKIPWATVFSRTLFNWLTLGNIFSPDIQFKL